MQFCRRHLRTNSTRCMNDTEEEMELNPSHPCSLIRAYQTPKRGKTRARTDSKSSYFEIKAAGDVLFPLLGLEKPRPRAFRRKNLGIFLLLRPATAKASSSVSLPRCALILEKRRRRRRGVARNMYSKLFTWPYIYCDSATAIRQVPQP